LTSGDRRHRREDVIKIEGDSLPCSSPNGRHRLLVRFALPAVWRGADFDLPRVDRAFVIRALDATVRLRGHGRPVAFYSDKASIFRVNRSAPKGGDGVTQLGRAMHALNIDLICANTPAAKGRVERAHQTLQDRLIKELRLRGIVDRDAANAYAQEFAESYNRRFARVPRNDHDAHRPLRPSSTRTPELVEHEALQRAARGLR
jgi:hypothetical protein